MQTDWVAVIEREWNKHKSDLPSVPENLGYLFKNCLLMEHSNIGKKGALNWLRYQIKSQRYSLMPFRQHEAFSMFQGHKAV